MGRNGDGGVVNKLNTHCTQVLTLGTGGRCFFLIHVPVS